MADLSAPLTASLLLNAVESAHDTLRSQILRVIDEISDTEDLTIDQIAERLGFSLDTFFETVAAHAFFIDTAEAALADAGFTIRKPRRKPRATNHGGWRS